MNSFDQDLPDFSGQVIDNGRLLLLRTVGSGSYGRVYRAIDTISNQDDPDYYAVKCLSKTDLTARQMSLQRRELRLHRRVSGFPHVLALHAIIEEELYLYLVLDLSSRDLFCAIKDGIYFNNNARIRQAFVEILDGVHACHQRGVYHRDLKPENILCTRDGTGILIADFGMATRKRLCSDFGCGSKPYMGPECMDRNHSSIPYSPLHTDIWALGIVLVNMVTGDSPWYSATPSDGRFLSFVHNPNFLCDVLPISQPLNELLKRVLNYDPAARISIPEIREEILNMETFYMTRQELRSTSAKEWIKELNWDYGYESNTYSDDFLRSHWTYDNEHLVPLPEPTEVPCSCNNVGPFESDRLASTSANLNLDPESNVPFTAMGLVGGLVRKTQGLMDKGILTKALATLRLGT